MTTQERMMINDIINFLVEQGLNEHLAQYGEHCSESWFCDGDFYNTHGIWARGGATKLCIGSDELGGWVIKVGYTKRIRYNYAQREYEFYLKAVEAGLEHYFPKTIYLGEYGGQPYFAQELADCDESYVSSAWYERLRDQYEEDGEEYNEDYLWDEIDNMDDDQRLFLAFGDAELCEFCNENHIGDFHEGNFGYIGDCLVIVDFSGWAGQKVR